MFNTKGYKFNIKENSKSQDKKKKKFFIDILQRFEQSWHKSQVIYMDYGFDLTSYDEDKMILINDLISKYFGEPQGKLILWYVCNRLNPETGKINDLVTETNLEDGSVVKKSYNIKNAEMLWNFLKKHNL